MLTTAYDETELMSAASKIVRQHGIVDEHDRDDAIQTVALRMFQAAADFDPAKGKNVKAYQWSCGKGQAKDFLKRQNKERTHERTVLFTAMGEDADAAVLLDTFGTQDTDADQTRAIREAFAQLSGREARIAQAHLLEGETLISISKREGISHQYTQEVSANAKAKLAKALAEWKPIA